MAIEPITGAGQRVERTQPIDIPKKVVDVIRTKDPSGLTEVYSDDAMNCCAAVHD